MSGNIPPFFHQNGIPDFLRSNAPPPASAPSFNVQYGETAPTPEQMEELANSTTNSSSTSRQGTSMHLTLTQREVNEMNGEINGAQIFLREQHQQQPISSMITNITGQFTRIAGVNMIGSSEGLAKVLSAIPKK